MAADGSDCGNRNVKIGNVGREIGGALAARSRPAGRARSRSDAWKGAYIAPGTKTPSNYSTELPLPQGACHVG